jgi:mRNA interferase RelE/StbE
MMAEKSYSIFFSHDALKELRKLVPAPAAEIVRQVEKKLTTRPTEYGESLHGELAGHRKLRVGGFRVVYRVFEDRVWVLVLAAGKRNEGNVDNIYAWLRGDVLAERTAELVRKIEAERKRREED